ncbi:MAG: MFS transporter [Rhodospirillaceae bacterium]
MSTHVDAFSALRNPHVRRLVSARLCGVTGAQILNVTVGWELYERTGSAWALGLIGLFELAPVLFLTIPAGNVADRYPRRNIVMCAQALFVLAALGLGLLSYGRGPVEAIYAFLVLVGVARTFSQAASSTILPQILPKHEFVNANAWMSSTFQLASVAGPALGGFVIAWTGGAAAGYIVAAAMELAFIFLIFGLPAIKPAGHAEKRTTAELFAGLSFIRKSKIFLAAITLDMFAVLFSGGMALLPLFAKDILHVGPEGLGWLRAAPSVGSMGMALIQTRLKPWQRPGRVLLITVAGFGVATIGFGLSESFYLSLFCLFLTGVFDSVSVVIRATLEQVVTPDELRGRVSAIGYVFIGFSNEFGSFWGGTTATLFGPVLAVAGGGIGSILVVIAVAVIWPVLLRIGPLHTLKPDEQLEMEAQIEARKPGV